MDQELIKMVTEKATEWLSPNYDEEDRKSTRLNSSHSP